MDNVVKVEDLPAFIEKTILAVRDGIALARKSGTILAELPKEIQFNVIVIEKWQDPDLAVISVDSSTGSDSSTGNDESTNTDNSTKRDVSTGTNTSNDTSNSTDTDTTDSEDGSNSHDFGFNV